MAGDVVDEVLERLEDEHAAERQQGGDGVEGGDARDELEDEEDEEVGVGEALELLEEVLGQEGEDVVFGRGDGVVLFGVERWLSTNLRNTLVVTGPNSFSYILKI